MNTTFEYLFVALGKTKNYHQALELVESTFPNKDDAWVIETTDALLELMKEAA